MATSATSFKKSGPKIKAKEFSFIWAGKNARGKATKGEVRATSENDAKRQLRRQGIVPGTMRKKRGAGKKVTQKDIALLTRQLATMLSAGLPLLQAFEIVARGNSNANVSKLLYDIRSSIEGGDALHTAFGEHPKYFNALYCNLIAAGETAGILEQVLDRLAIYQEKTVALKGKIKSALFYPSAIIGAAVLITAVIMIFVIPSFKSVFASFGADLPAPTLMVMAMSEFMVANYYLVFGGLAAAFYGFIQAHQRSPALRNWIDAATLKMPIFGALIEKAILARWSRTLSTMSAAGVPLVEALGSVAGAAGNNVFKVGTERIQAEVSTGASLADSMTNSDLFPTMALQLTAIGEESGSLDEMLAKVADFYEAEVDDAVAAISSLMEPLIMVVLGVLIGGIVIAMYLPIFKMGAAV